MAALGALIASMRIGRTFRRHCARQQMHQKRFFT